MSYDPVFPVAHFSSEAVTFVLKPMIQNTMLDTRYFGNSILRWLIALGIVLLISVVLKIALRLVLKRMARFAAKTNTTVDDLAVKMLGKTKWFFLLSVSLDAAAHTLRLPPLATAILDPAAIALVLVQAGIWANEVLRYVLTRRASVEDSGAADGAYTILGIITRSILWILILLLILDNFGVNITALIAGLGVGGIAIALAVQNVLGDLFASVSIVLDKPFAVGDAINVDTLTGTVEKIGLKSTRVRSVTGEQLIFSNADLLKSRIRNFKRMEQRRVILAVAVAHSTTAEQLATLPVIIRQAVERQATALFVRAHFKDFSPIGLNVEAVYDVLGSDYLLYMNTQERINLEIHASLREAGIELAHAIPLH